MVNYITNEEEHLLPWGTTTPLSPRQLKEAGRTLQRGTNTRVSHLINDEAVWVLTV
jgi:hypothetical protein